MSALSTHALRTDCPPSVRFFSSRPESFGQYGSEWRRMTVEDEARHATGYDRETREASVGIHVIRRPNGLLRVGFDLWRLDVNLQPAAIERIEARWRPEAASFSKSLLRSVSQRAHFSKSFMRFEIAPERLREWQLELSAVLSNPESYQSL